MKTGRNIAVLAVSLLAVLVLLWIGRGGREPEKTEVSVTEKQAMTFAEGEIRRIAGEGGPDCTWDDTTVILLGRPLYGPDDRCNGYVCRLTTGGMETGYLQVMRWAGSFAPALTPSTVSRPMRDWPRRAAGRSRRNGCTFSAASPTA